MQKIAPHFLYFLSNRRTHLTTDVMLMKGTFFFVNMTLAATDDFDFRFTVMVLQLENVLGLSLDEITKN